MRRALGLGLAGAALGIAAWGLRRRPGGQPDHATVRETETAVARAIAEPPIPGTTLRASALTARIVELTGVVADARAAREAVRRARAVEGVTVVVDRLETRA